MNNIKFTHHKIQIKHYELPITQTQYISAFCVMYIYCRNMMENQISSIILLITKLLACVL